MSKTVSYHPFNIIKIISSSFSIEPLNLIKLDSNTIFYKNLPKNISPYSAQMQILSNMFRVCKTSNRKIRTPERRLVKHKTYLSLSSA